MLETLCSTEDQDQYTQESDEFSVDLIGNEDIRECKSRHIGCQTDWNDYQRDGKRSSLDCGRGESI